MTTLEKIRAEIAEFEERIAELPNMADAYAAVWHCLDIIDKYAEQEPCDDVVSRQAVLDRREILRDEQGTGHQAVKTKYIRELPSVQPKQKTGRWIWDKQYYIPICDKCGAHPWKSYIPTDVFKFCPNCGARMYEN